LANPFLVFSTHFYTIGVTSGTGGGGGTPSDSDYRPIISDIKSLDPNLGDTQILDPDTSVEEQNPVMASENERPTTISWDELVPIVKIDDE
jgi:hypothetical protein